MVKSSSCILISLLCLTIFYSCQTDSSTTGKEAFEQRCATCHQAPEINQLTKQLWTDQVLPDMGARLGIKTPGFNPLNGLSYSNMEAATKAGIYPLKPIISQEEWHAIKSYVLDHAPDSLETINTSPPENLNSFKSEAFTIDSTQNALYTFLKWDKNQQQILLGDVNGKLQHFDFNKKTHHLIEKYKSPVVDFQILDQSYTTLIGILDPSELVEGQVIANKKALPFKLHRPVYNQIVDLNNNSHKEMIVSEFGHFTGQLSLLITKDSSYQKQTLWPHPGVIKTEVRDMNNDGKLDIVALTAQGDESIIVFYQQSNLQFESKKILQFSPIYGSSWFVLKDMNQDGLEDIIIVNGDNADKTFVNKPYHGLRIYINQGNQKFTEQYFYPMYGATRCLANDYDQDGDIDLAIISTFPDYKNSNSPYFAYLENTDAKNLKFEAKTFSEQNQSRWFLMDDGDFDQDGDIDIVLSAFTYVFTPVPQPIQKQWRQNNHHIMVLNNQLKK